MEHHAPHFDTGGSLSPFAARVFGIAIIVGPLLLLASTVAYVTAGEGVNEGVLGGTVGVWSVLALGIAFVGLLRLVEPHAPRAAVVLTVIALIGFPAGVAFNVDAVFVGLIPDLRDEIDDAMTGGDAIAIFAFLPWGLFAPLTLVLTGIVLWRTRAVARWSAILLVAGGVLFVASRPERIDVLAVIADLVIIAGMAPIGWALLSGAGRTASRAPAIAPTPASAPDVRR